jgi:hypothetical protein
MNTGGEGMSVATTCLMQGLIAKLIAKEVIVPSDVADLVGEAEEYLAGLRPDMMSPDICSLSTLGTFRAAMTESPELSIPRRG